MTLKKVVDGWMAVGGGGGGAVDGCGGTGGVAVAGCKGTAEGAVEEGRGREPEPTFSCWCPDATEPPSCVLPPPGVAKIPSMSNSVSSACSLFT